MTQLNQEEVREYWTSQAVKYGSSSEASWTDIEMMHLEVRTIKKYLKNGDAVLDAGCANGYSTVRLADGLSLSMTGADYIPAMIEAAKQAYAESRVDFCVADITKLPFDDGSFDKVVVIRVLINLGTRTRQLQALRECRRVLKPGGTLLLSEATEEGLARLNAFRAEWGLPEIPVPPFNTYLSESDLRSGMAAKAGLSLEDVENYASTYFVGTRVLKPLLAKLATTDIDLANPLMEFNRWIASAAPIGDYGTQKLFVFKAA